MIKVTYKPGKYISSLNTLNEYHQIYWDENRLWYKGYAKNGKHIGYREYYIELNNKGIKYRI